MKDKLSLNLYMRTKTMKLLKPLFLLSILITSSQVFADGASENISNASKHSVLALTHGVKGSVKVVSGVVAIPLIIVGNIGPVSQSAGTALMTNATGKPLKVSDVIITAAPSPKEAMKTNKDER